jgi:hypothetical protein
MGECRELHDQKPHDFNSSCNVTRMGREYCKNGRDATVQKTMLGNRKETTDAGKRTILRRTF